MSTDLHPTPIKVYGYGVAWIPTGHTTWTMELDEDYLNLPAHYATLAEAADRVRFLQEQGFRARAVAVLSLISRKHFSPAISAAARMALRWCSVKKQGTEMATSTTSAS